MKIGDYVRTEDGIIRKIENKEKTFVELDKDYYDYFDEVYTNHLDISEIIKSSPNIIDLIEPGDYVNGLPVANIEGTRYNSNDLCCWLSVGTEENKKMEYSFQVKYGDDK